MYIFLVSFRGQKKKLRSRPSRSPLGVNSKFPTSIPTPLIWGVPPPGEQLSCIRVIAFPQAFFLEQFFLLSIIILFSYFFFFFFHMLTTSRFIFVFCFFMDIMILFFFHILYFQCAHTQSGASV